MSPFVAAGTAVWLARRQDRERVSCFVDWSYEYGDNESGPYEWAYIGIHNRSPHPIAIRSARFQTGGLRRTTVEGTTLAYEDPWDLGFPYRIEPGDIRTLMIDDSVARKIVHDAWRGMSLLNGLLKRPRVTVECVTTAGTRLHASAEEALPWDERQRWARA